MKSSEISKSEQPTRWAQRNQKLPKGSRNCTSIYFDPPIKERLLKMAVRRDCSLSVVVNELIKKELNP